MKQVRLTDDEVRFIITNLAAWESPFYDRVIKKLESALQAPDDDNGWVVPD